MVPLLLIDTCTERPTVALVGTCGTTQGIQLPDRGTSAYLLETVRTLLVAEGLELRQLTGIGVVSGPGSFTGVRVGMAVAKGLCVAAGLPMAAVSRLAVLAQAAGLGDGFAVLRAGRGDVYVREQRVGKSVTEAMMTSDTLLALACGSDVACEQGDAILVPGWRAVAVSAVSARELVEERLRRGGDDVLQVDANYVRQEQTIYRARQSSELRG